MDFETQSTVDLVERGVWAYVNDDSTRIMSAVFKVPGRKPITWVPRPLPGLKFPNMVTGVAVPDEVRTLAKSHIWVAHNAEGFDALLWSALYPSIRPKWQDTQLLAKSMNLPGSLDKLSKWFGGAGKDSAGSRAMKLLCRATFSRGRTTYPKGTTQLWEKMLAYNVEDVEQLAIVYGKVKPALKYHASDLQLHSTINDRGITVDRTLAKKLLKLWSTVKKEARDNIAELTGGELTTSNIRSGQKVHAWLRKQGLHLDNLRREEVALVMDDPDQLEGVEELEKVRMVLEERALVLRTAENKLQRVLDTGTDVLRYLLTFHAAATGRFASRGVQIHNLPARGNADVETLLQSLTLEALGDDPATSLNMLVRPVFRASKGEQLGIVDFASIEARGIAWIAEDVEQLDLFRAGSDVYLSTASELLGREITKADVLERGIGKVVELASGYGMGGAKLELYCRGQRIDLAAFDLDGKTCIKVYRKKHPAIVKVWANIEHAALTTLRTGRKQEAGRCLFAMDGDALTITLPSGRPIYYQKARVEQQVPHWAKLVGRIIPAQDAILYQHPHGYPKTLYGGLLAENCVQAICRDIMVDSMHRLEAAGFDIRLHVHDEVVFEDGDLQQACDIMATPPTWAEGFPVAVEGFTGERYTKKPFKGAIHATA